MGNTVLYGYVRVSSKDQHTDRQIAALTDFGVRPEHIYTDKQSGKDFNREAYQKLIKKLRPNDTIVILSLDRLGRNYKEILEQWRMITKVKTANVIVLDMPLLNTQHGQDDLTQTFLADMVLQVLSYVAEIERRHIKIRQAEGIAAAKARGVKFGRVSKPLPKNYRKIMKQWKDKAITGREAAKRMGVSSSWLYRKVNAFAHSHNN